MKLSVLSFSLSLAACVLAEEQTILDPNLNTDVPGDAQAINYSTTPPWYALDHLNTHCAVVRCSGKEELVVGTNVVKDGLLMEMEIHISAEALFKR
ncbi:hypothetical protein DL770_005319 [Monosporascus sp. CRB-9-2]|nr:hypothetical protein DL770_005319 [Monosporascus sp. CRB-9-2]